MVLLRLLYGAKCNNQKSVDVKDDPPSTIKNLKELVLNELKGTQRPDTKFSMFFLNKNGEQIELNQNSEEFDQIGQFLSELDDEEQIDILIKEGQQQLPQNQNISKMNSDDSTKSTSSNFLKENPWSNKLKTGQSNWKNIYSKDQNTFHMKNDGSSCGNIGKEDEQLDLVNRKKESLNLENALIEFKKLNNSSQPPGLDYQPSLSKNKPNDYNNSIDNYIDKNINDLLDEPEMNTDIDKLYYNVSSKSIHRNQMPPNEQNCQNLNIEEPKGFLEYFYQGDEDSAKNTKSKRIEIERHVGTMNQKAREQMNLINQFVMDNTYQTGSNDNSTNIQEVPTNQENPVQILSNQDTTLVKNPEAECPKNNKELTDKISYLKAINKDYCNDIVSLSSKLEFMNIDSNPNQNIDSNLSYQLFQKNDEVNHLKNDIKTLQQKVETCDAIENSYKLKQNEVIKQKGQIEKLSNDLSEQKKLVEHIGANQNGKNIIYELAKTIEIYRNRLASAVTTSTANKTNITIEQENTIATLIEEMQDYSLLLVNTQLALENKDKECQKLLSEINKLKTMEPQLIHLNSIVMHTGAKLDVAEKSNKEKDTYISYMQQQEEALTKRLEEQILSETRNEQNLDEYQYIKDEFEIKNQEIVSIKGKLKDSESKREEFKVRVQEVESEKEHLKEKNIEIMIEIEAMKVEKKKLEQSLDEQVKANSSDYQDTGTNFSEVRKLKEDNDYMHAQNKQLHDQISQFQKQILDQNLQNLTKVDTEQMIEDDEECSIFEQIQAKKTEIEALQSVQDENNELWTKNDEYMLKFAESESMNESLKQSLQETGIAFDNLQQEADNKLSQQLMEFLDKENKMRNEYENENLKQKNFIQILTTKLGPNQIVMNPTYNNELNMNGNFNQLGMPIPNQYPNEAM